MIFKAFQLFSYNIDPTFSDKFLYVICPQESLDIRYLQCKAAVRVGLLKKFLRLKYKLPDRFQVGQL